MSGKGPYIRASEIGQYVYCARAWWLGQAKGYRSRNVKRMADGERDHLEHGREVRGYHRLRYLAVALVLIAVIALAMAVLWLVLGSSSAPL